MNLSFSKRSFTAVPILEMPFLEATFPDYRPNCPLFALSNSPPELRRFLDVIEQAVDVGIRENQPIQFA
jgi:hypothetical protein